MVFGNERRKEIQNVFVICIELSEIKDTDIEGNLDTAVGYVSKREKTPKPNAGASYWNRNIRNWAFRSFKCIIWILTFRIK